MGFSPHSLASVRILGLLVTALMVVLAGVRAGTDTSHPTVAAVPVGDRLAEPVPVAVNRGRASLAWDVTGPGEKSLLVVSSLARRPGPFPIELRATALATPGSRRIERPEAPVRRPPQLRGYRGEPVAEPLKGTPPRERRFQLMMRDGDVTNASNYGEVRGVLRAVGKRVQVYVGAEEVATVRPDLLQDIVETFDDRIYPVASKATGLADDVDGDGRFTVLVSGWLGRLGNGRHAVDGFVRVSDLDLAFAPPFGNRCDMMYVNSGLTAGPYLRTILAHEYMHAVVFGGKSRSAGRSKEQSPGIEEEGWLDEAIAHLAEDMHAFSRTNIDYRVAAYLAGPERYQLVVGDYYAADLFRSHGNRGSTYLFLRWCAERFGRDLIPTLIQSPLSGTENLEAATGCRFSDLYRDWSVELFLAGLGAGGRGVNGGDASSSADQEEWQLGGPRASIVEPGGEPHRWSTAGTSSHYVVLDSRASGGVEVEIEGPEEADIQVTLVPLPSGLPSLRLEAEVSASAGGEPQLRGVVRERDGQPLRLVALSWGPLVPAASPRAVDVARGRLDMLGIASTFGSSALAGHGILRSRPVPLAGEVASAGPIVVRAVGVDSRGRRVSAWAEIPPHPESASGERLPLARSPR
ncbi:hypothetical protein [Aquisphaera insulae]|uniref:hypothetical protein n=1 Tax=Aquisphaera insulae TaxID=2712864 RepID=UPI0013EC939D|nr:hypothetical protein [Aquisphaera insulae]